jgi:hypothetical protein
MPTFSYPRINVIAPYKHPGMWVFDDARVVFFQEPFVEGADVIIDGAVSHAHGMEGLAVPGPTQVL